MSLDESLSSRMHGLEFLLNKKDASSSSDLRTSLDPTFSDMNRSMSMIELRNVPLVHELNDVLEALSDTSSRRSFSEVEAEDDEFFFYDDVECKEVSVKSAMSSKDSLEKHDFVPNGETQSQSVNDCCDNKIRRVNSFAGFQNENFSTNFVKALRNVATITEEESDENQLNRSMSPFNSRHSKKTSTSSWRKPKEHKHCPFVRPRKSALKNSSDEIYVDKKLMRTYSSKDMKKYCIPSSCSSSVHSGETYDDSFTSSNSNELTITRNISFSTLEVRMYGVTLGDNPGGTSGPPVTLDWNYGKALSFNLEDYEAKRRPRRTMEELHMDMNTRYFSLASRFTASELRESTRAARQIRINRKKSLPQKRIKPIHQALKSTEKLVKKFLRRNS